MRTIEHSAENTLLREVVPRDTARSPEVEDYAVAVRNLVTAVPGFSQFRRLRVEPAEDQEYVVVELGSLGSATIAADHTQLKVMRAARVVCDILPVLRRVHEADLEHGDVSPESVAIFPDGHAELLVPRLNPDAVVSDVCALRTLLLRLARVEPPGENDELARWTEDFGIPHALAALLWLHQPTDSAKMDDMGTAAAAWRLVCDRLVPYELAFSATIADGALSLSERRGLRRVADLYGLDVDTTRLLEDSVLSPTSALTSWLLARFQG